VRESSSAGIDAGDEVVLNGWGAGETHLGGYAEVARVPGEWLVPKPPAFSAAQTMAIGTAGYTAMLCVLALEDHGVSPDDGPVLVTGAAGGVGSIGVSLAASEIIDRSDLSEPGRPMGKERWAGALDCVGSHTLANVLAETRYGGTVAACGLAQGMDLPASVAPFILRGVTLAGVDSVMAPRERRLRAWARLAEHLDATALDAFTTTRPLADAPQLARDILAGQVRGRVVITV
jgi:acrylyl-CoA reductase (NADPH)